jgi:hypothetical protein
LGLKKRRREGKKEGKVSDVVARALRASDLTAGNNSIGDNTYAI